MMPSQQILFINSFEYYQGKPGFNKLQKPGVPLLVIKQAGYHLVLSLHGGQLLECERQTETGIEKLLWLSPFNSFSPEKAIRGGIPLCLPWFGVHPNRPNANKHGFVRQNLWQLDGISYDTGSIKIDLSFEQTIANSRCSVFPWPFKLQQNLSISEQGLELALSFINRRNEPVSISWAWHTYFAVDSLADVRIHGLEGQTYLDNCQELQEQTQSSELTFGSEVDRVFQPGANSKQIIQDINKRQITICSEAPSCVVWNPGEELAATMPDINQGFEHFICLERGAAFDHSLCLQARESYQSNMLISWPTKAGK